MATKIKGFGSIKPTAKVVLFKPVAKKPARRADQLWGKSVIARGFTTLPTMLFLGQARLKLQPDELNVILQIAAHRWDANQDPFLSKETIAKRMGKNARTVQRYLTQLEEKGLVRRIKRFRTGHGQAANGFSLDGLVRKLEALEPEFRKLSEQNKIRRRKVEVPAAAKSGA